MGCHLEMIHYFCRYDYFRSQVNRLGSVCMHITSVENQKGVINIQRCSVENQKGAIAIYIVQQ